MRNYVTQIDTDEQHWLQRELKWHSNGMKMVSAPVSWKSSPVPLWQLAWSSSHSSTRFPLGVVGPAVGTEIKSKYYNLTPQNVFSNIQLLNLLMHLQTILIGGKDRSMFCLSFKREIYLDFAECIGDCFILVFDPYLLRRVGCLSILYIVIYINIIFWGKVFEFSQFIYL